MCFVEVSCVISLVDLVGIARLVMKSLLDRIVGMIVSAVRMSVGSGLVSAVARGGRVMISIDVFGCSVIDGNCFVLNWMFICD